MLHFLGQFNDFPRGRKNGLVTLFLPKFYVELAIRILPNDESAGPVPRDTVCAHFTPPIR